MEPFQLHGKNVIVTGAGGAIGSQIAVLFAKAGAANLILSDVSDAALRDLGDAVDKYRPFPGRLLFHRCDVSKEEEVMALVQLLDDHGGVDVMLNNAGVFPYDDGDAITTTGRAWELTHNVNVMGTWHGCKHAVLSMRRHGKTRGSVINTASVAGLVGSATAQIAYTASKGAIIAMTRELAMVHAKEGFRFNSLCPAPLGTALYMDFLGSNPAAWARREVHLPQGRLGEPVEQAYAALFLASDASSFVNAQELVVDGGMTKAYVIPEGEPCKPVLENF